MPRRRTSNGPKRHRRDKDAIADLFVKIDKRLVKRAQDTAEYQNINLWEVVEEALRNGLPPVAIGREPEQAALIEVSMQDLKAS
ncbi:hypothetical protein ACWELJ_21330 [Nocardia sp. NPDC004582]